MKWTFEKFKGDMAIYATCPNCGFRHNVSVFDPKKFQSKITNQYIYCPMCGKYLFDKSSDIKITLNDYFKRFQ